jgi:hypothetical protein
VHHWDYPSKGKAKSLLSASEDFRLFTKDLAQGQIITHIADRPLNAFLEAMASGIFSLVPQFYAGTNGAPQSSVPDKSRRYHLLLQPKPWSSTNGAASSALPDVSVLFEKLFRRETFLPEPRVGANMLLVTFANWFVDEIFRTEPNTRGSLHRYSTTIAATPTSSTKENSCAVATPTNRRGGLLLAQLYGTDEYRAMALRSFQNGKMKTGEDGGLPSIIQIRQEYPDFAMICSHDRADQSCNDDPFFYATGHERFNFHPGHLLWTELFLREHNHVAEMLQARNPDWDDQRLFETARTITEHLHSKFIFEEYISMAISSAKDNVILKYDPNRFRKATYDKIAPDISLEFNHLYRFHALVAEQLEFEDDERKVTEVPFHKTLWKPNFYHYRGTSSIARAFYRTRMGSIQAHNTPGYLKNITMQTILDERAQSMRGYNDYREFFTLPRLKSLEDLNAGPQATKALKELYKSIDDVDLFVGAMVEQRYSLDNTFLSEMLAASISSHAFSTLLNQDIVKDAYLYSEEFLTQEGLNHIATTSLSGLLERHFNVTDLPCGTPFITTNVSACPFIEKQTKWRFQNIQGFVGLDFALDDFFEDGFFHAIFTATLFCFLIVFVTFFVVHNMLQKRQAFKYRDMDLHEKFRLVYSVSNIANLTVTAIPYTYLALMFLFGPDVADFAERHSVPLLTFILLHGIYYTIEVCARLLYTDHGWLLLFHHTMWFIMLIIPSMAQSIYFFKLSVLLDVMVTYEVGLFVAILLRRHSSDLELRVRSYVWGGFLFLGTRIIQLVVLISYFAETFPRMNNSAKNRLLYALGVIFSSFLVVLQFYTMTIYHRFYCEDTQAFRDASKEATSSDSGVTDANNPTSEKKRQMESSATGDDVEEDSDSCCERISDQSRKVIDLEDRRTHAAKLDLKVGQDGYIDV